MGAEQLRAPVLTSKLAETHNPLVPLGSDIAGIVLSIVVIGALVATIALLLCTSKRGRRGRD